MTSGHTWGFLRQGPFVRRGQGHRRTLRVLDGRLVAPAAVGGSCGTAPAATEPLGRGQLSQDRGPGHLAPQSQLDRAQTPTQPSATTTHAASAGGPAQTCSRKTPSLFIRYSQQFILLPIAKKIVMLWEVNADTFDKTEQSQ